MLHRITQVDEELSRGFCLAHNQFVDVYKNGSGWRCGPATREARRKLYLRINPAARKYKRHAKVEES